MSDAPHTIDAANFPERTP